MRKTEWQKGLWLLVLCLGLGSTARGINFEVFAKGSFSKSHIAMDKYTTSVSASTGLGIILIPQVRIEGRYTNITALQNKLDVVVQDFTLTLNDIKTQTAIYSVGLDLDLLGEKYAVRPFIFVGAGYIETARSYLIQVPGTDGTIAKNEPKQTGISANLGAGFRVRIARALAFEVECFAYGVDIHKPNPLVNFHGTVGVRIFI